MKTKIKFLTLLVGLFGLVQAVAAASEETAITCVEINGPFGAYTAHDRLVYASGSTIAVSLESRQSGWKTKTLYYTTASEGLYYLGTSVDLNYALENGIACAVSDSDWKEATAGTITCKYDADSGYDVLVICHEPYTYSVSFQPNGGSGTMDAMTSLSYTNTTTTLKANAFSRTGYTFAGWALGSASGSPVFANQSAIGGEKFGVTADGQTVNLYAKWSAHTYRVHYAESTIYDTATYDIPFAVAAASSTGYTFDGWTVSGHDAATAKWGTSADDCSQTVPSDGKVSSTGTVYFKNLNPSAGATVTLTARRKAIETAVTFSQEGGRDGTESLAIVYGTSKVGFSTIKPPTKTGETFQGYWTTQASGGDQYFDVNGYLLRDWDVAQTEVTLYARWSSVTYTVAFDPNGGSGTIADKTVAYSESFALPDGTGLTPPAVYNSFVGWSRTANGDAAFKAGDKTSIADNSTGLTSGKLTFYAVWQDNRKTISVTVGEYGTASPATLQVVPGQPYGTLPTVTAKSYKKAFAGWFADETGDTPITEETIVPTPAPSAIYARWSNATYVVRFNGNGATSGTTASQTVEFSVATALTANAFARTGYAFAGWATTANAATAAYADGATVTDLASSANATVDLYAVWTANAYSVAFDANGGGGTMPTLTERYDAPFTLPSCTFTEPAFSAFGGWTDAATGAAYAAGATVSNLTATADATVTLKAVWNSTLSDLSKAMHCNNLMWEADAPSSGANEWKAVSESGIGHGTDTCVRQTAGPAIKQRYLAAKPGAIGVLSFWLKRTSSKVVLAYVLNKDRSPQNILPATIVTPDEGGWTPVTIDIKEGDVNKYVLIMAFATEDGAGACLIDGMTWTPDGTNPTPTEDDAVEASSVTVSDSTLSLSFTGDSRFSYHLQATDSLAPADWYDFGATNVGTGAAQSFAIPLDATRPRRFFRIETIPK